MFGWIGTEVPYGYHSRGLPFKAAELSPFGDIER